MRTSEPDLCSKPQPNDLANALFKKWIREKGYADNFDDKCFTPKEVAFHFKITEMEATFLVIEVLGKEKVKGFHFYDFEKLILKCKDRRFKKPPKKVISSDDKIKALLRKRYGHLSFDPRHKHFDYSILITELGCSISFAKLICPSPVSYFVLERLILENL